MVLGDSLWLAKFAEDNGLTIPTDINFQIVPSEQPLKGNLMQDATVGYAVCLIDGYSYDKYTDGFEAIVTKAGRLAEFISKGIIVRSKEVELIKKHGRR